MKPRVFRRAAPVLGLAVVLGADTPARAGQRVPYGGHLSAYAFGGPLSLTSDAATDAADRAAARALFEPLYRLDGDRLVPVLAADLPIVEGPEVRIPLRAGVRLHDGRALTPRLVAASLRERVRGTGAHVVRTLVGFSAARASDRPESLQIRAVPGAIVLRVAAPYPRIGRLLASAHAGIGAPSPTARREVGTGPYRFASQTRGGGVRLVPFERHRDGRPYLDRLTLEVSASRSFAAGWSRRVPAGLLLTLPIGLGGVSALPEAPAYRVVLRVGDRPDRAAWSAAIEGALGRARLAQRFLGERGVAQDRLLTDLPAVPPAPPGAAGTLAPTRLLVSQADPAGWQFAKRVQLDLLRAGITATLERRPPAAWSRHLRAPERDLVLAHVLPDAPPGSGPEDRLHTLLSLAAGLGQPEAVTDADLRRFGALAPEARAAHLDELEARVRSRLGLVVIGHRPMTRARRGAFTGLRLDPFGAHDVADAYRAREPAR